jgi:NADH-quinone oxidoreductase subunit G
MDAFKLNPFNHDLPAPDTPLVNVQLNGVWIQAPKGANVVEVVAKNKGFLPHYCYHPKLSISGNCRMCLFEMGMPKTTPDRKPVIGADGKPEIAWIPRPQIGCATQVSEGMGIRTHSPMAEECRKGVMEFLLINHPLDCPICDQAGECKLQEFSSQYGTAESRFVENKVKKPKNVDLGARIVLDDERCILCSRCVRFAKEVVKDDVLGFVNRGSHNTLTAHPGRRFDNAYSLNTVDICPVGALTSKDFRFKMRVWFLKETKSICAHCSRGCNITIGSREGLVYRFTPRTNEAVNSHWMCDHGRFTFHPLQDEARYTMPFYRNGTQQVGGAWADITAQIGRKLKEYAPGEAALLASAALTNEELFLARLWARELGITLADIVPRSGPADDFLRMADKTPNSAGAKLFGLSAEGANHKAIADGVRSGKIKALIAWQEDAADIGLATEDLAKLDLLVAADTLPNATTRAAHYVLPVAGPSEKRGTMINGFHRLQRLNQAVRPAGSSMEDWQVLLALRQASTGGNGLHTFEDVFKAMVQQTAEFTGLTWAKIGDLGLDLNLEPVVSGAARATTPDVAKA